MRGRMDVLLTYVLSAGLFLALEVLWCRPSRNARAAGLIEGEQPTGISPQSSTWDPFALSFVQQRMDALAAELEQLDNDELIFAKAFRTHVAKAAYEALLADASRLGDASRLNGASPLVGSTTVEVEIPSARLPLQEELKV
jgi:hypothetical protein